MPFVLSCRVGVATLGIICIIIMTSIIAAAAADELFVSGAECYLCKVLVGRIENMFARQGRDFTEEDLLRNAKKTLCNRASLQGKIVAEFPYSRPAIHYPSLEYDCETFMDRYGPDMMDALSLEEDLTDFCVTSIGSGCKHGPRQSEL
ncbi:hypothetical protein FOZ62_021375 [Perkinsus olseni]|uniref:Saposin B-type domain-containing protein n=1 Tax=Perkinsus olseni TaxID=32597 RepID=A0A7J6Q486_PEROL|nr:hypothetical protein FOZ62_021375 [Perkinsus olseni]